MRLLFFITLLISGFARAQQPGKLLQLKYGNFYTGLSQENLIYNDSVELVITKWYPARKNGRGEPLKIKDCLLLDGLNRPYNTDSIANDIICGDNYKINRDILRSFLELNTRTYRNGDAGGEKFPVILWSYRHGTEYYQFAMNEYLASHGFIVYTVSRVNPKYKMAWDVDADEKAALHKTYLEEMSLLLNKIKADVFADTSKIALFSWSYGGDAAIFFQQAHPEIDCVFGFSSIDFSKSFFLGDKMHTMFDTGKLNRPYYLFYEETSRLGNVYTTDILHRSNKSISSLILFPKLWHGNFNYMEGYMAGSLDLPVVHQWSRPGKDAVTGYESVCGLALIYVQQLFNSKNKHNFKKQIDKLKQSLPDGFIK